MSGITNGKAVQTMTKEKQIECEVRSDYDTKKGN